MLAVAAGLCEGRGSSGGAVETAPGVLLDHRAEIGVDGWEVVARGGGEIGEVVGGGVEVAGYGGGDAVVREGGRVDVMRR